MNEDLSDNFFPYAIIIGVIILILLTVGMVYGHGNLSVYDYDDDYIIWNVGGNTLVWIDGVSTEVSGLTYGQYELQPGTEHIGCNIDGNCTGITTKQNSFSIISRWGVYFILVIFAIAAYFIPVMLFPSIMFGTYLIAVYLPDVSATPEEYAFIGVMLFVAAIAALVGYKR